MRSSLALAAALSLAVPGSSALAAFVDDFETPAGSADWDLANPAKSQAVAVDDFEVSYGFDYGTLGIAARPGGSGTRGLGFRVNVSAQGAAEGVAVHPIVTLPDDYTVTAWAYIAYGSGAGSTEHLVIAANTAGTSVPFAAVPAGAGVTYGLPHDSGLAANATDDYYRVANGTFTQLYGDDVAVPDPDTLDIPDITSPDVPPPEINDIYAVNGFLGGQWFCVELSDVDDVITLKINGTTIDTYNNAGGPTTGDLLFGAADIFGGSANPTIWHIWDDVTISEIPEPAAATTLLLAGSLALARRRRR